MSQLQSKMWELFRTVVKAHKDFSDIADLTDSEEDYDDIVDVLERQKAVVQIIQETSIEITKTFRESVLQMETLNISTLLHQQIIFTDSKNIVDGFSQLVTKAAQAGLLEQEEAIALLTQ